VIFFNFQVMITFDDFLKVDIRIGTIISAEPFPEAHKPAYKLTIDFGPLGVKRTSAQITQRYVLEDLPGKKIAAVVNFPSKQIANFISECLVLGAVNEKAVTLLECDGENGDRVA
jgi:tRNA-binding protein